MLGELLKAIPIGLVMAFMIGPVFFALLETSAIKGFRAAVAFDLGVMLADVVFVLVAYFMTSSILEKLKDEPGLFIFGGMILVLYGVISFVKTKKSYLREIDPNVLKVTDHNYVKLAVKGFLLNFINIGVLGFWLGLIVIFGPEMDNKPERVLSFFGVVIVSYFVIDLGKILLAKSLNSYLTPFRIFWLKRIIAIVMIICGAVLVFKGLFPDRVSKIEKKFYTMPKIKKEQVVEETLILKPKVNKVKKKIIIPADTLNFLQEDELKTPPQNPYNKNKKIPNS